jgi:hypothetical protein
VKRRKNLRGALQRKETRPRLKVPHIRNPRTGKLMKRCKPFESLSAMAGFFLLNNWLRRSVHDLSTRYDCPKGTPREIHQCIPRSPSRGSLFWALRP